MAKSETMVGEWYIAKKARDLALRRAIRDSLTVIFPLAILAGVIILYSDTSPWLMLVFLIADWFGIAWVSYNTHFDYCYRMFLKEAEEQEGERSKKEAGQ